MRAQDSSMPKVRVFPPRSIRGWTALVMCAVAPAAPAGAERLLLYAQQDAAQQSAFVLDFGVFGADSAVITSTNFVLELNVAAASARFIEYQQAVPSLDLPGGIPTGPITVGIVAGTSSGTYGELRDDFATTEVYAISFAEDLSGFGLFSPVHQPGAGGGTIDFAAQTIDLGWSGQGQFGDPRDPVVFAYQCSVHATFEALAACDGDVDLDGSVGQMDLGALLAGFGTATGDIGFNPLADFDADGEIGQADLGLLLTAYGEGC